MKPPRPKTHIVESHESLVEGQQVKTLCDVTLSRPKFVAMTDSEYVPGATVNMTQPKGICPACLAVRTLRYLAVEATDFQNLDSQDVESGQGE